MALSSPAEQPNAGPNARIKGNFASDDYPHLGAARLYNMKLHSPTRLYDSRSEALRVVRALQAGEMTIDAAR